MLLIIDSATAACSAALVEGARVVDERYEVIGRGHAELLMPMIQELLGTRRPSAILVDCGPGSFTGVRVGLAAAHGLSIGWRAQLFGYSSLTAVAALDGSTRDVAVALHGGHGELFVQSFGHAPLVPLDELQSLAPEAAAAAIKAPVVIGSAAAALVNIRGHGEAIDALPRASAAAGLPEALRTLEPRPIYGRAPDAKPMFLS